MKCVSIVIPVYNVEKYLSKCLESVIQQTYTNLEIILIDDGSQDGTLELCKGFEAKDVRVKTLHQQNQGVSYTRNKGIMAATGDYVMFVDGDDFLEPFWVEHYVTACEKSGADIVVGGLTFLMQDGERHEKRLPVCGSFGKELWNLICTEQSGVFGYVPNKLYRTALLKKNNVFFDETMYAQEDLDFALSAYGVGQKFHLIDTVGYIYRYFPGKRLHPLLQYMKNQLKMLALTKAQTTLNSAARSAVSERAIGLLYTYLYYLPIDKLFIEGCKKLETQTGLDECINSYPCKGEMRIVCRMVRNRRYRFLKFYFYVRHNLRWIIRRSRI